MRARLAIVTATLIAAGCGSYRRVAPLDDGERAEIASLRASLTGRRVVVPNVYGGGKPDLETISALGVLGIDSVSPIDGATTGCAEIDREGFGRCLNGMMLTILTLGVVPYPAEPETDWRCKIVAPDGRETVTSFRFDDGSVIGWLALPLGVLPGWSPFFFSGPDAGQRAAIRDRFALFLGRSLVDRPE